MQTKEQKKKNTLLIGVGIAGGVLLGAGLATLGFKRFMKTDKAFDICRANMWDKYPRCDLQVVDNGMALWGSDANNRHKFLMGWAADSKDTLSRVADKIKDVAEAKNA